VDWIHLAPAASWYDTRQWKFGFRKNWINLAKQLFVSEEELSFIELFT
jgi:hypothetical protein